MDSNNPRPFVISIVKPIFTIFVFLCLLSIPGLWIVEKQFHARFETVIFHFRENRVVRSGVEESTRTITTVDFSSSSLKIDRIIELLEFSPSDLTIETSVFSGKEDAELFLKWLDDPSKREKREFQYVYYRESAMGETVLVRSFPPKRKLPGPFSFIRAVFKRFD